MAPQPKRRLLCTSLAASVIACSSNGDGSDDSQRLTGARVSLVSDVNCPGPDHPAALGELEQRLVSLINKRRAAGGTCGTEKLPSVPAANLDATLVCVARAHSLDMATRGFFDHTDPDSVSPFDRLQDAGYDFRTAGENIAKGQPDATSVLDSWMTSEPHCRNVLGKQFEDLGVGLATDTNGLTLWTLVLGTRY